MHKLVCCSVVSCQVDAVLSGKLVAMQALLGEPGSREAGVGCAFLCEVYELHKSQLHWLAHPSFASQLQALAGRVALVAQLTWQCWLAYQ
jgi:hypothetical protein